MAKLRGARLVCFYCGKRSDTRYDNRLREFPCQNCEATNYLDSHGDITDPPVATTGSAPSQPARYAIPRATSPVPQAASSSGPSFSSSSPRPSSPSPSSEIFCARCLKNQELFTACLRQYEDSDDDDDDGDNDDDNKRPAAKSAGTGADGRAGRRPKDPARAQRKWFAYRRNIERLYPQVCAACEPRVLARVEQTRYTAKTDHLRRMMERSRTSRAAGLRRRTALDRADAAGWLAWWAGLALQLAWHVTCVLDAMAAVSAAGAPAAAAEEDMRGDAGGDGGGGAAAVVRALALLGPIRRILPPEERLGAWAVYAALLGVWWNPQFVQVCRGFVKHILGLRSWYVYQAIFLAGRLAARRFLEYDPARNMAGSTLITGHAMVAALTLLVYVLARRAVRVDTTPLFTDSSHVAGVAAAARQPRPPSRRVDGRPQTLSDVLDQVLASSPPSGLHDGPSSSGPHPLPHPPPPPPPPTGRLLSSHSPSSPLQPGLKYRGEGSPSVRLSGLSLGDGQQQQQYPAQQPQRQPAHYGQAPTTPQRQQQRGPAGRDADEMDWSPAPAVPRAFSAAAGSAPGNPAHPFSEAPTQPDHGPFWYKVPAAPVHPARQLRNPRPSAPRIIEKSQSSVPLFRSSGAAWGGAQPNGGSDGENRAGNVPFSEPIFFAPEEKSNDAANKLADMLSASFSLAQYDDGDDDYRSGDDESSVPGAGRPKPGPLGAVAPASSLLLRHARTAQAALLAVLLAGWGWHVEPGRGRAAASLGTLVSAGLIALWDVTSVVLGIRAASIASGVDRMIPPWRACLATTVHLAEIGLAAHVGRLVWDGEDGVDGGRAAGMGLLAEMAVVRLLSGMGVFGVGPG